MHLSLPSFHLSSALKFTTVDSSVYCSTAREVVSLTCQTRDIQLMQVEFNNYNTVPDLLDRLAAIAANSKRPVLRVEKAGKLTFKRAYTQHERQAAQDILTAATYLQLSNSKKAELHEYFEKNHKCLRLFALNRLEEIPPNHPPCCTKEFVLSAVGYFNTTRFDSNVLSLLIASRRHCFNRILFTDEIIKGIDMRVTEVANEEGLQ